MTPGKYDLEIYRGDSYRWRFTLWQDEAKTIPVDLTGVAKSEIRDRPGGTTIVVMECTMTAPNIIDVVLSPDKSALTPANGVWDLQVTVNPTEVRTYVAGKAVVTADVTDSVAFPLTLARV